MKKHSPVLWSLMSAAGVTLYVLLVAWFMTSVVRDLFGPDDPPLPLGPFLFLLLFVLSAAIVGSLVFGKPALLYLDGNKKEALATFFYTLLWLAAVFVVFILWISANIPAGR